MFSNTFRACATTSSPPTSSRFSPTETMPLTNRRPRAATASVKCEIGSAWPATRYSTRRSATRPSLVESIGNARSIPLSTARGFADLRQGLSRCDRLRIDHEVENGREPGVEDALERCCEVLRPLDSFAVPAVRRPQRGEVGIDELGRAHASRVLPLLVHPDRPQHAVVDYEDDDRSLVLDCGGQLLDAHRKIAVTRDADDDPPGMHELRGHRRGDAVAHRPTLRCELRPVATELVEAVRPHGEVAGAVGDRRVL